MKKSEVIYNFLNSKNIAVVGVSGSKKKFGYSVFTTLKEKGYNAIPVNPNSTEIDGLKCYPSLKDIPGSVDAAILVIPPKQTELVVKDAQEKGIEYLWMQQGSESPEAIKFCKENGINYVDKECIMMFAEPVTSIHKFHRWINKITGKLPA